MAGLIPKLGIPRRTRLLDSATFLSTVALAEAASAAGSWDEAVRLWRLVSDANPVDGRYWTKLGEARAAAGDEFGAIEAFDRSIAIGDGFPFDAAYQIARCYARSGERLAALDTLERALELGFRELERVREDDAFATFRDDPRFQKMAGIYPSANFDRVAGWQSDVAFFGREVKRRAYAPFRHISNIEFDEKIEQIRAAVPTLTDLQIILELQRLLVRLRDGHAGIYRDDELRRICPLSLYQFEEGIFVTAVDFPHGELLGAELLMVEAMSTQEALDAVDDLICRDNEYWPRHVGPYRLREAPVLHALGLAPNPDRLTFTFKSLQGETLVKTLETVDATASSLMRRAVTHPETWNYLPESISTPLPRYLTRMNDAFWCEAVPASRLTYAQINSVRNMENERLPDFANRVISLAESSAGGRLVLDLRWNGGGNTFLEMPLVNGLIGCKVLNRPGQLFVIIGRATFSAAQNLATMLERHTDAIFVGEPTGSSPTFVGETIEFQLPYSKAIANVSDLLWQSGWAMDYRPWIPPGLYAPPTFETFRENRDPAMEAIEQLVRTLSDDQ